MWVRLFLIGSFGVVGLAGCVEESGAPAGPDRQCSTAHYRIESLHLPQSLAEANHLGFNLDAPGSGDTAIDNQIGALSANLTAAYDLWDPQAAVNARLARGDVWWLLAVDTCDGDPSVAVSLEKGDDDDGDGKPTITEKGVRAIGVGMSTRDGVGLMPIGYVTDGDGHAGVDSWEAAVGTAISLRELGGGELAATVGMGLQVGDDALAPVAAFLTEELATGSLFAGALDTDHDHVVTVAELRASPAVQSLLADDLDLMAACDDEGDEQCYRPGVDGVNDRLSIGFEVRATPVTVE